MLNARNDWLKVYDKKKDKRGFMDQDEEEPVSFIKEKAFISMQTSIPETRKDMNDLKKER